MGYLPDDRKADGCISELSVRENIILALQTRRGLFRALPREKQEALADQFIELLNIKHCFQGNANQPAFGRQPAKGNTRALAVHQADFLILDEPTRGIDIGTKTEFQKLMLKFASEGMSVVFISSEIEEMLRTCSPHVCDA